MPPWQRAVSWDVARDTWPVCVSVFISVLVASSAEQGRAQVLSAGMENLQVRSAAKLVAPRGAEEARKKLKEVRPDFSTERQDVCRTDTIFVKFLLFLERLKRRLACQPARSSARTALLDWESQGKLVPALLRDAFCSS